jgi:hypothetical protein
VDVCVSLGLLIRSISVEIVVIDVLYLLANLAEKKNLWFRHLLFF